MARFTARIELHEEDDYRLLHEKMEAVGFLRTIKDTTTGIFYEIPNAEYNYIGPVNFTKWQVMTIAKRAT